MELLEEALNGDDFKNFVKSLHKIVLHISLSDPPITLDLIPHEERLKKTEIFDKYEFKKFKKQELFCIDGFPKEDLPAVVVYPPPMKGKYVYQGIKPSVITLPDAEDDIVEYVSNLKEEEKLQKTKLDLGDDKDDEDNQDSSNKEEEKEVEVKSPPTISPKVEKPQKEPVINKPEPQSATKTNASASKYPPPTEIPTPVLIEPKERVVSPVPKDLTKSLSSATINIMNKKDEILNSQPSKEMVADVVVMDDVGDFQNSHGSPENSTKFEGTTRFANLKITTAGDHRGEENETLVLPVASEPLKRRSIKNISQTIDPEDIKFPEGLKENHGILENSSSRFRSFL